MFLAVTRIPRTARSLFPITFDLPGRPAHDSEMGFGTNWWSQVISTDAGLIEMIKIVRFSGQVHNSHEKPPLVKIGLFFKMPFCKGFLIEFLIILQYTARPPLSRSPGSVRIRILSVAAPLIQHRVGANARCVSYTSLLAMQLSFHYMPTS